MLTFIIIVLVLIGWSAAVILLDRAKVLERWKMSRLWGIFLMWRTEKGKDLIDLIARPKGFWRVFAVAGLFVLFIGMFSMFFLIFASAMTVVFLGFTSTVSAQEVFVLPGINPYVPLIFGLVGLVVAVVAHEFSHGIQARANDLKVKSLGLLFLIVPVGAFMEPDEEEVQRASRLKRIKMYASGPIINFILAFLSLMLFTAGFMGSLENPQDPFIVTDLSEGSSLFDALGDDPTCLYEINGTRIRSVEDIYEYGQVDPGEWITVKVKMDGSIVMVPAISGVVVTSVSGDSPASDAGLKKGAIIVSLDGRKILSKEGLTDHLDSTRAGDGLVLEILEREGNVSEPSAIPPLPDWMLGSIGPGSEYSLPNYTRRVLNVTLADKYEFIPIETFKGDGFLGIGSSYMGISGIGSDELLSRIKSPVLSADSVPEGFGNLLYLTFSLPLSRTIVPFHAPITDVYEVGGPMGVLPEGAFWFMANTVFYLFWLNILLALFNALPAYPLDGGFIFKDSLVLLGMNFRGANAERLERIAGKVTVFTTVCVFGLILVTWLYPYVKLMLINL